MEVLSCTTLKRDSVSITLTRFHLLMFNGRFFQRRTSVIKFGTFVSTFQVEVKPSPSEKAQLFRMCRLGNVKVFISSPSAAHKEM